jgi:hypothetical protein
MNLTLAELTKEIKEMTYEIRQLKYSPQMDSNATNQR